MRRLLFGDVGTGKTAVAMAAIAQCVATKGGAQAAVLAPTGVLAEQYLEALAPLARATGSPIALLTGDTPAPQRARPPSRCGRGEAEDPGRHGTPCSGKGWPSTRSHWWWSNEQHRLGVAQRLALVAKGRGGKTAAVPHLLTLSATPDPADSVARAARRARHLAPPRAPPQSSGCTDDHPYGAGAGGDLRGHPRRHRAG